MNYDKEVNETKIKGVTIKASKEALNQYLGLSARAEGRSWSANMISKHLGENEEEKRLRKKGAQGVPL